MFRGLGKVALATGVLAGLSSGALAETIVRCTSPQADAITLDLGAREMLGRVVGCIDGSFVADMTPCAPDGEYGLSAPTGAAGMVEIVQRWQDYGNHSGGVVTHFTTPTEIYFSGGFMYDSSGYTDHWSFQVDRLTGKGELRLEDGEGASYECAALDRKF